MTAPAKHTPGPWRIVRSTDSRERWDIGIVAEGSANIHAECFAEFWKRGDVRPDECEANARLIASAPALAARVAELEAALARILPEFEKVTAGWQEDDDDNIIAQCRAALKAGKP